MDDEYTYPNTTKDNGVDIYIIDSGVRSTHVEFATGLTGDEAATYTTDSGDIWYDSHGTHVAGIAGGQNYGHARGFNIIRYLL